MHAAAGIGGAGAARDEGDSGPAGHLAVGIGHIADPALVPANGDVDFRRVVKRVENREETLAGNGEDAVTALDSELVDEDLATGAFSHGEDL